MLISNHFFLLYFFPLFLLIYFIFRKSILTSGLVIILFSLIFYISFGIANIFILVIPLVLDYFIALLISKTKHKSFRFTYMALTVAVNLLVLVYFKYAGFFFDNLTLITHKFDIYKPAFANILLPVGISFITFQRISYIIDVYKRSIKPEKNFIHYATYASLFPHLLSGPIVRFSFIKNQLRHRLINAETIFTATKYFVTGFALKVLIANQLYTLEEAVINNLQVIHLLDTILFTLYFSLRIYMDFLGYSFMAIGLAKFIGFDFPINFDSPYKAINITEFWNKWNITLSRWLRDYLYIPLGGNRKGKIRTYINLMITMLLAGLWHGASWSFVIWGGLHGMLLVFERILALNNISFPIPKILKIALTFFIVTIAWIPFRLTKISELSLILQPVLKPEFVTLHPQVSEAFYGTFLIMLFALLWSFVLGDSAVDKWKPDWKHAIALICIFLFTIGFSLIRRDVPFIYFQF